MNKKSYIVVGVVVVLAVLAGYFLTGNDAPTPQPVPIGGVNFEKEVFLNGFETYLPGYTGGKITTLTTGNTVTVLPEQFCDASILKFATTIANASTTLPTSASITSECLTQDGQRHSFWFANISTTAASTTIVKAGTGMILMEPDGQNVVIGGGNKVLIDCVRNTSAEVWCVIDETIDAD